MLNETAQTHVYNNNNNNKKTKRNLLLFLKKKQKQKRNPDFLCFIRIKLSSSVLQLKLIFQRTMLKQQFRCCCCCFNFPDCNSIPVDVYFYFFSSLLQVYSYGSNFKKSIFINFEQTQTLKMLFNTEMHFNMKCMFALRRVT